MALIARPPSYNARMPDQPKQPDDHNPRNEKPISLHPLSVEEALKRAMQAKPAHDESKPKKTNGGTTKKGR